MVQQWNLGIEWDIIINESNANKMKNLYDKGIRNKESNSI